MGVALPTPWSIVSVAGTPLVVHARVRAGAPLWIKTVLPPLTVKAEICGRVSGSRTSSRPPLAVSPTSWKLLSTALFAPRAAKTSTDEPPPPSQ